MAVIGDGSLDNWEVFQFETAELIGDGQYRLRTLLRGQLGSDALMPAEWPIGSYFVFLNAGVSQLDLSAGLRGIDQYFRIGPAQRPYSDHTYRSVVQSYTGNALRPYAPVHLSAHQDGQGELQVKWLRRSHPENDSWGESDIALKEAFERYQITIKARGNVLRQAQVDAPYFTYTAAAQSAEGAIWVEVAQISDSFGAGPARKIGVQL